MDDTNEEELDQINAEPTKTFFVDMLTRDIGLEQAVLDLVDNSVDGAKLLKDSGEFPYEGRKVVLEFGKGKFRIFDNCGGFSRDQAKNYAFRFGRASGSTRTPHSIGQFGVGMKRALFKFGDKFLVRSASEIDTWAVSVTVSEWEAQKGWHFPWAEFAPDENLSATSRGTEIVVEELRSEVGWKFSTAMFQTAIITLIKSKHRQFIAGGLTIVVNGHHVDASNLYLLMTPDKRFAPGVDELTSESPMKEPVKIRIVVGVGYSSPREAGWYVVCNGRVVLEADRRQVTGWGLVEDQSNSVIVPSFHNQFARFRGIVTFDCDDSGRVPWNTTKTDVVQDSPVWQSAFSRMIEMMRPVITFLNELDNDIDEYTKESSPLHAFVVRAEQVKSEDLSAKRQFAAPARGSMIIAKRTVKIQYSRPLDQVEYLMHELSVSSGKAVGEKSFDLAYHRSGGK